MGLDYVAEAGIAEGGGGYRAYGYYHGLVRLVGHGAEDLAAFGFVPIEKVANGGGAEEQNGFQLSREKLVLAFAFWFGGEGAIGDDFGDLGA